jgi:mono/diheme cytochrome c family protein
MKIQDKLPKLLVLGFLAGAATIMISRLIEPSGDTARVRVTVPDLSPLALKGGEAFAANCATCHGVNAAGTKQGPPLVHDIYNPGHHADEAFVFAARYGVRRHHWPYGDMPAQPQVSEADLTTIIQYVRELQVANGITYRPHNM